MKFVVAHPLETHDPCIVKLIEYQIYNLVKEPVKANSDMFMGLKHTVRELSLVIGGDSLTDKSGLIIEEF